MAISIYYSKLDRTIDDKKIILEALDDLGSMLISGYYNPMNKLCFSWKSSAENTMRLSETGEVVMEKLRKSPQSQTLTSSKVYFYVLIGLVLYPAISSHRTMYSC